MRRKAIGEKEKAALRKKEGGATLEEEEELLKRLAEAEAEITSEIEQNSEHFEKLKDSIIGGFKKACIYEMKLTKEKGADLTEEENDQAHREAADALKKRYLRDRKALADSLEAERVKRRKRILEQLAQRKKKLGLDEDAVKKAEMQAARELVDFERDFTEQEKSALEGPQKACCSQWQAYLAILPNLQHIIKRMGKMTTFLTRTRRMGLGWRAVVVLHCGLMASSNLEMLS